MLVRKTGPFAPSHSFSFTSVMSRPVCCSHSWEKMLSKRRGSPYSSKFPRQTESHSIFLSLHSLLFFSQNHCLFLSLPLLPSPPLPHSTLHLTISLPSPKHLSSTLSCTHSCPPPHHSAALCENLSFPHLPLSLLFHKTSADFPRKCFI